jgi:TonB family protein
MIAGIIALLTGTFAVGSLVYGLGGGSHEVTRKGPIIHNEPESIAEGGAVATQPPPVVVENAEPAPLNGVNNVNGFSVTNGTDPTAMSAQQYEQLPAAVTPAATSTAPFTGVDPRVLTATPAPPRPAQQTAPKPERAQQPAAERHSSNRTRPRPIAQPIPDFDVHNGGVVRLDLTIGSDGRVKEIEILKGVSGLTAEVVDAARHWRFEPATEDGRPVEGTFKVDIAFNSHD